MKTLISTLALASLATVGCRTAAGGASTQSASSSKSSTVFSCTYKDGSDDEASAKIDLDLNTASAYIGSETEAFKLTSSSGNTYSFADKNNFYFLTFNKKNLTAKLGGNKDKLSSNLTCEAAGNISFND